MNNTVTANTTAPPWYRHLWPWLLMLPPLASVVGGVSMVYLATHDSSELVIADYSRIEQITADRFAHDRQAAALRLQAEMKLGTNIAGTTHVEILVSSADLSSQAIRDLPSIRIQLQHAGTGAADRDVVALRNGDWFVADVVLRAGNYMVEITPPDRSWRLAGRLYDGQLTATLMPSTSGI